MYTANFVKNTPASPTENLDEFFEFLLKLGLFSLQILVIILELINLKIQVLVSEPCDVIRAG